MTLLRVHDQQQILTRTFVRIAKQTIQTGSFSAQKKEEIYFQGQELGFCNDEIQVLLEELVSK